ncbi:MAG: tRNA lysidine(34) synthetase TilS [candidate division WOR-3 bacterium]|nr:tRNA lysidine(34) synthetase TilS [candidate division WOR-3 bacterium]MCX7837068.1 tRNA lysidine(34) synthetase TilS [candidate division WOR-3 bacterium]MDW8113425.1 tRNA lysidine(34) synthetase TilS [candidate division WOR-3 bacterium]
MQTNKILKKIEKTIEKYQLLEKNDKVLVAFSGGKDSVCLLYILYLLREKFNLNLIAFHLNHLLRGKEAERDEKFCKEFCKKLNIPIVIKRRNVKKYSKKNNLSIEEAGHKLRYYYYEKIAQKEKCQKIALAHTASDNIETILLSLIYGQSLGRIAGILPKREKIIRPLIDLTTTEILEFLKENNLSYVEDSTNKDLKIPRNYLRHIVIPNLKKLNSNLEKTLRQVSEILISENEYLEKEIDKIFNSLIKKEDNDILISKKNFINLPLALKRRILKKLFPNANFPQIEEIISLTKKQIGKKINLEKEIIYNEYEYLRISKKNEKKDKRVFKIKLNKINNFPEINLRLTCEIINIEKIKEFDYNNCEYFDNDDICLPLFIRFKKEGDVIQIKNGKKKVKKLFSDMKISQALREKIPILCDQKGILWILGVYRAYRGFINEKTKKVIKIKILRWQNPIYQN